MRLFRGSRFGRRVLWVFVLSALLPLAISDWVASAAVSQIATSLQTRSQAQTVRQTALQVRDRLVAARALLLSLASSTGNPSGAKSLAESAQAKAMFSLLATVRPAGEVVENAETAVVLAAWRANEAGESDAPYERGHGSDLAILRPVVLVPGAAPVLLMSIAVDGTLRWVGALKSGYVWEPLHDATIDNSWRVSDDRGRTLASGGDPDLAPPIVADAGEQAGQTYRTRLFLNGDFATGDWLFADRRLQPAPTWQGAPLGRWLAGIAAVTVLGIALLGTWQIRRAIGPLERLTEATRQLASGASDIRVSVAGEDELATLGRSFNDMSDRIAGQFRALAERASIDREMLTGTPIDVVAGSAIVQLAAATPTLAVAILWLEPDGRISMVDRPRGANSVVRFQTLHVQGDDRDAFRRLGGDRLIRQAPGVSPPWSLALEAAGQTDLSLMPLTWQAETQAVLAIASPELTPPGLAAAADLRDRLAVAFSARLREAEMAYRASHDSLTGLANRHGLNGFVDELVRDGGASRPFAIMFVDIDHFKDANDSLGHEHGDAVLCEAGRRLGDCAPANALIARQGGDEFVIVMPDMTVGGAQAVAAETVRLLGLPFAVAGELYTFGASVGLALHPEHGSDRKELLRHADIAMYAAKAAGRGRQALFDPSFEEGAQTRLRLPTELRRALEHGEFVAHYQPRVRPATGRVTSAEGLIRWNHPERGLLMPDAFIALAEESRIIEDIGLFMLNDACSRIGRWRVSYPGLRRVSVNVSPRQLTSGDLAGQVRTALTCHGVPAEALELEVTERLLVEEKYGAHQQLAELRRMGVSIALDDFGTGYSSMSMLRNLPVDVMKIDRAFVKDLGTDSTALAIIRAIATLAGSLDLQLVAEGVETARQAKLLAGLGCDELQGFLYSPGLPAEAFARYCEEQAAADSVHAWLATA